MQTSELRNIQLLAQKLSVQWSMFDELYNVHENYDVFQKTGPVFWGELEDMLLDTLMLSISRFLDPASNHAQENLCLEACLDLAIDSNARDLWNAELIKIRKLGSGVQKWRNKKISHSDKEFATGVRTLPTIQFAEIKSLIEAIVEFVRKVTLYACDHDIGFVSPVRFWVPQVMQYLKDGIRYKAEQTGGESGSRR